MTGGNIILCGFMGCGKSTVGRELARRLGRRFIDMDEYIESREGVKIADIFRLCGEDDFREREHAAVLELAKMCGAVIAAGGGALAFERNVEPLRNSGVLVYLNLGFDECYGRIAQSDRPLVQSNSREHLEIIFKKREGLYRSVASHEVDASGAPEVIAERIIKAIELKKA